MFESWKFKTQKNPALTLIFLFIIVSGLSPVLWLASPTKSVISNEVASPYGKQIIKIWQKNSKVVLRF